MTDGGHTQPGRAPSGGRHARAQELVERRARGEELGDYDRRILDAHLAACPRCREWADQVGDWQPATDEEPETTVAAEQEETVAGGQEEAPPATVGAVEAATPTGETGRRHVGSEKDAMGQDKRREVIGHSWGPSKGRQLLYYGLFVAFVIAVYIGGKIAVDELDAAPTNNPDQAPWSQPNAPQTPPQRFQ